VVGQLVLLQQVWWLVDRAVWVVWVGKVLVSAWNQVVRPINNHVARKGWLVARKTVSVNYTQPQPRQSIRELRYHIFSHQIPRLDEDNHHLVPDTKFQSLTSRKDQQEFIILSGCCNIYTQGCLGMKYSPVGLVFFMKHDSSAR
jgi:hypothetical protein